jgi:hypothetical protein
MNSFNNILTSTVSFEEGQNTKLFGKIKINPSLVDKMGGAPAKKIDIRFEIDNSGSMSDLCSDGRRKMEHVLFAAEQLIRKIQESPNVIATASMDSFDDDIKNIFSDVELTPDSVNEISQKMRRIVPSGATNIYKVLKKEIETPRNEDPSVISLFVLLTDGQATSGKYIEREGLQNQAIDIHPETMVIMVGCGLDHDNKLFTGIQRQRRNSEYLFVSDIEKTMETCSETIYKILNTVATNVAIDVQGGEIYNWLTNTWDTRIEVSNLSSGIEKTYNVRTNDPEAFRATLSATDPNTLESGFYEMTKSVVGENLEIDKYRQRTLETLFEANKANGRQGRDGASVREAKKALTALMVEMKKYMDENGLREDKMMKLLCDDIWTCHQTIGTMYGEMYTCARQTSQATQSIYCALPPPCVKRGLTHRISQMEGDDDDELLPPHMNDWSMERPTLKRGMSVRLSAMQFQDDEDSYDEDLVPDEYSAIQNCSMITTRRPRRATVRALTTFQEDDDAEGDFIMEMHETSTTEDSPYAVDDAVAFIRGVVDDDHHA